MKRVASESLNRYDYPFTDPIAGETPSDVIDVTLRQPARRTIEELRDLPLPPFTFGIRCESQNGIHGCHCHFAGSRTNSRYRPGARMIG